MYCAFLLTSWIPNVEYGKSFRNPQSAIRNPQSPITNHRVRILYGIHGESADRDEGVGVA